MSGDWSPDQPLRADATDEQMRERIDAIGDEMLLVPAPADWRNDEAVRHAWNIALLAAIDGIRNGVIGEEMKAALDNLCVRVASCGRDEDAPWHEDEALSESIGALVDDRHFFEKISRGAAWSIVLDICTKAVSASCGRGTEGEDTTRLDWLQQWIDRHGELLVKRWTHDGRRQIDTDGFRALLVHDFQERGGEKESLRDAIDAEISP